MKKENIIYLNHYLINCKKMNKSFNTIRNYETDLRKFITWFEAKKAQSVHKINHQIISNYKDFLINGGAIYKKNSLINKLLILIKLQKKTPLPLLFEQKPLAVGSQRRHLSAIKNFYEYLKQTHEEKNKKFRLNPVKSKIHAIKLKDIDVIHTPLLTPNDWKNIQSTHLSLKEQLMTALLYYGGPRLNELRLLKKSDFNNETKTVRFIRKGGAIHHLKVENFDHIYSLYLKVSDNMRTNIEYLFCNSKGRPLSQKTIYNRIKDILHRANTSPSLSPHSFRKACATNLYKKTKDLIFVKEYLNHKDAKVTQTYIEI